LSEVIVKNSGGRMSEQPLLMSSALWACARSLGFLMGYKLNNLIVNVNSQHVQHDEVGARDSVQSKTIFSYRMSHYPTTSI